MALWTDIIDPATLTGYARRALSEYEAAKGTLARYLPNRTVLDTVVRFTVGQAGLVLEAAFRAYDAEPEVGKRQGGKRVVIELPAIGQNIPISEYEQLRTRNATDEQLRNAILNTTRQVVQAVADRIERQRGIVLTTGVSTIDQANYNVADDFGRAANHTVTAATLWSDQAAKRLDDLVAWADTYEATNGDRPGSIVMSRAGFRSLANGDEFRINLIGGGSRRATDADVQAIVTGEGLPEIEVYTRRTSGGLVLPADRVLLLPAPVDTDAWEDTQLGATFWGQTLTSTAADWGIEDAEQPGIVSGVYRNEKPPMIAEVISDAIALPVLANANLSFAAKVL